jgi:hypothetical protein
MGGFANILLGSGRIRSWNPGARRLWGFDAETVVEISIPLARCARGEAGQ